MQLITCLNPWLNDAFRHHPQWTTCDITGLQNNSHDVKSGDLFLAYPGARADGRDFIPQAIAAGAVAVAYDPHGDYVLPEMTHTIPVIPIPQLSQHLSQIADVFFHAPSRALYLTGVTGTNGKTTIAYQLAQAYQCLNQSSAYVGTLGQGRHGQLQALMNTTPDGLCVQRLLHQYQQQSINHVCMEVSSHALALGRVAEVAFQQAIFTNITHEHMDFHHTFEAYIEAKALLFSVPALSYAILNHDDPQADRMALKLPKSCQRITYGLSPSSDVFAESITTHLTGSDVSVRSPWGTHQLHLQTIGRFNVYNGLAVLTSLLAAGQPIEAVLAVMPLLQPVPGRMEVVVNSPCVIVDYAHTPDALENALSAVVDLKQQGRLWMVFGCGGSRDTTKRPLMGRIASQYADEIVITSDNPREEDPEAIMQDIAAGLMSGSQATFMIDRKAAIEHALSQAKPEDVILIAGKGHETYQQKGQTRYPFSDQAEVKAFYSVKS